MKKTLKPLLDKDGAEVAGYKVYEAGGVIYFRQMIDGEEIKFSTGETSLVKARMVVGRELKRRLERYTSKVKTLLGDEIEKYIAVREKDEITADAMKNIRNGLKQVKPFWQNKLPSEITADSWRECYEWFKVNHPTIQFENANKVFRTFCKWLNQPTKDRGVLIFYVPTIKNPEAKKTRKERKRRKSRIFTDEEFTKIYQACELREQVLVLLMYTMAFRVESDALSARWDQFHMHAELPFYHFGEFDNKAGLEGRQAIHEVTLEHLKRLKEVTGHSEFVFPQQNDPTKHLRRAMIDWPAIRKKSGVTWDWSAHRFRHSCLTKLAERGFPMHLICKCYRISAQEFMNTYAHLTPEGLASMQNAMVVVL